MYCVWCSAVKLLCPCEIVVILFPLYLIGYVGEKASCATCFYKSSGGGYCVWGFFIGELLIEGQNNVVHPCPFHNLSIENYMRKKGVLRIERKELNPVPSELPFSK